MHAYHNHYKQIDKDSKFSYYSTLLDAPWGAASVADHNTKPWENINHGDENNNILPSSDQVAPLPSSTIATPITQPEVVEEAPTSVSPSISI